MDAFSTGSGTTLSDLRRALKTEIESVRVLGRKLFEVWINEDAPREPAVLRMAATNRGSSIGRA